MSYKTNPGTPGRFFHQGPRSKVSEPGFCKSGSLACVTLVALRAVLPVNVLSAVVRFISAQKNLGSDFD